jgi:periplasmic protein TonB
VNVRFLVNKDGTISDVEIMTPLNPSADQIAKEVISKAPLWIPGIYKNKLVRSYHTQPISIFVE